MASRRPPVGVDDHIAGDAARVSPGLASTTVRIPDLPDVAADVVLETITAEVSERGATRMDDKTSDASMEKRKKDGYF